ncbi:MAG: hypothetical protein A2848_01870 [Candidatus Magasanikbacteria bacterium RIFCSPHIGHO2_01_FULL_50_8]|uniref:Uncharacterized protein n=2 Tax=Candidatus Magasanikiibacteriota TaxID=1752731 RepID=A0A1F6LN99_9BACT|nr:MAG: hypothetical protein A2848_01870 [Candidatus Magasanikbacteria bacterium RIFCSPHIGHO2_01_FULL_50_8]OGH67421.1 MAG: hypothetical protein A3C15_00025 [Candidatus Magasanikbacteria bacterium RIFCSPHIGHO2_02_FULL_50_9b]
MKKIILVSAFGLLLLGGGCSTPEKKYEAEKKPAASDATAAESAVFQTSTFQHLKFGFSFDVPGSYPFEVEAKFMPNGNDVVFLNKKTGTEIAVLIVQPGIPGIPLADDKIEKVKVGGVAAHLYHDLDPADGGKVDRLIADFPDGKNTIRLSVPELPNEPLLLDLKEVAASWKWKK